MKITSRDIDDCIQRLDSDGNALNMNRNDNDQFNVSNDNRDNRNGDNGPRQKFLIKSP
ncbi:MAG TPA: hypothetical protein VMR49_00770 [Candidatus Paceibacterota bacterium]|nr:hypothetical protein [Candidatus Paceibacterota bacterium]